MIQGIYRGPLQACALEGEDYVLCPGKRMALPECAYVQNLIASKLFVPDQPQPQAAPKAAPQATSKESA
jgi:hypothetical protein